MGERTCSIEGCDRIVLARKWCNKHYKRWKRYGDPSISLIDREHDGRCSVPGCEAQYECRGLCNRHYLRWRVHGDPEHDGSLSVDQRIDAKIEKRGENDCWLWIGARSKAGYGQLRVDGKSLYAHRLVYEREIGLIPAEMLIMHLCDNPPCVNPAHLSVGTETDNKHDMIAKGRASWQKG